MLSYDNLTKKQKEEIEKKLYGNYDKQQTILAENGCLPNPHDYAHVKKSYTYNDYRIVLCPFCLSYNQINKFLIKNKNEVTINKLIGICPNCQNTLQLNTLDELVDMTVRDFAWWVYKYHFGFWVKVVRNEPKGSVIGEQYFKDWCKKANQLSENEYNKDIKGFWDYYKMFKGEYLEENKKGDNE
jgi:hypothetical protein